MCLFPRSIKVSSVYLNEFIQIPCGKCLECLKTYQNDWMVRLYYESTLHSNITFVTLTYNQQKVPQVVDTKTGEVHLSLCKKHFQDWIKRFRRSSEYHNRSKDFKYFMCGEYGPTTLRPHYHVIFFGLRRYDILPALKDWEDRFGFTHSKNVQFNSNSLVKISRYVSKYCSKGVFSNPKEISTNIEKAFRMCSKGIGKNYVQEMKSFHLDPIKNKDYQLALDRRLVVLPDNKAYPMPRYYREKIYGTKNLLSYKMFRASQARSDDLYSSKLVQIQAQNPTWTLNQAVRFLSLQSIEDKKSKHKQLYQELARFYQKSKI